MLKNQVIFIRHPSKITILRGNHESRQVTGVLFIRYMVFMMKFQENMEMEIHGIFLWKYLIVYLFQQ